MYFNYKNIMLFNDLYRFKIIFNKFLYNILFNMILKYMIIKNYRFLGVGMFIY